MRKAGRVGIIVGLVSVLLVSAPGAGACQSLKEADALTKKSVELYNAGKFADAISLAQRALSIRESALGSDNPDVARSLSNLATLYNRPGSLCRRRTIVQTVAVDTRKDAWSEPPRCGDIARRFGWTV
jgi:hypothetical protein